MKRHIAYGASVAGGVPVISGLQEGLAGDELFKVCGILNGTCNFILSKIEATGADFDKTLAEAQELGFAEADPTDDLEGLDARAKLAILARVGLRSYVPPESITCRTIRGIEPVDFDYSNQLGCTIRQISWAEVHGKPSVGAGETYAGGADFALGAGSGKSEFSDGDGQVWRGDRIRGARRGRAIQRRSQWFPISLRLHGWNTAKYRMWPSQPRRRRA